MAGTITYNATRALNNFLQPQQGYGVMRFVSGVLSANLGATNTFNYFTNTASVGDRLYIGLPCPAKDIIFNVGTPRNGSVTAKWEFWNGSAWVAFTPVSDGTNLFSVSGINTLTIPLDTMISSWATNSPARPAEFGSIDYGFPFRIELLTVSGLTSGGAQVTDLVKYKDNTILVDGYTSGAPATLDTIYNASVAGGWGVVTKVGSCYTITANLHHNAAGFLKDTSKILIVGDPTAKRLWTSLAGSIMQFGDLAAVTPDNMAINGCEVLFNNANGYYSCFQGDLVFYGGSFRSTATHGPYLTGNATKFIDCNVSMQQGVIGGTITARRMTIFPSSGGIYYFTKPASEYTDVTILRQSLNIDPNYHPRFIGCNFVTDGNWRGGYVGSAGAISYSAFDLINCTITDPSRWSVATSGNTNFRTENFFCATLDVNLADASGVPIQGASVRISNKAGVVTSVDSGTTLESTNAGYIDRLTWGTNSFNVVDGTKFAINDFIQIDFEVMQVTGKAGNVLTVSRAQQGTFIGKHNMDNALLKIYKIVPTVTTGAGGAVPQQLAVYENRYSFGTATPAPYNDNSVRLESYNPFTLDLRKYGYVFQSITKAITSKDLTSAVLSANPYVSASEAAAGAYTGITINGAAKTITVTQSHTMQRLYDYCQWWACQASNMAYPEPITTVDGQTYSLASGWSMIIQGGAVTDAAKVLAGTLAITSGGYFEDRTGAIWDVAGTLYYGAAISHTAKAGAAPVQSVALAYYAGNTNLTYSASRAAVSALFTDANGQANGYAVWKIGSTNYSTQSLLAKGYGYRKVAIPRTISGPAISDTLQLTADPYTGVDYATAGGYAGVAIVGDASIEMTVPHTMQELYDRSQWWDSQAANLPYQEAIGTNDGANFNSPYDLIINGVALSGSGSENLGSHTLSMPNGGSSSVNVICAAGVQTNIVLTNLVPGSRVQLYDLVSATEICNAVSSGSTFVQPILWTANHSIRVRVMWVSGTSAKKWCEVTNTLTGTGMTLQIEQVDDPVYNAIGIDGATVTECSIVGTTMVINIDDPDNTTTAQRLYAFEVAWLATAGGIRDQALYVAATDSTHFVFEGGLQIKNTKGTPLQITGGNIVPASGPATDVLDLSGGSIFLNFNRVEGFAYMTQGGLLPDERTALLAARTSAELARQMQTNKAVISPGGDTVTVYDDNGTAPLHVFQVSTDKKSRVPA